MYSAHRGMVPAPNSRLTELLDQVQTEFESRAARTGEYEHQIATQRGEMELVRQKVHQLEQQQIQIKQKYDDEIARLHRELAENHGVQSQPPHVSGPPLHSTGHSQGPQPPVIGHGNGGLFGGTMANGPSQDLAPPQEQPQQQQPPHQMPQPPPVLIQQAPHQPQQTFTHPQSKPLSDGGHGAQC